jgi:hypothetical protein
MQKISCQQILWFSSNLKASWNQQVVFLGEVCHLVTKNIQCNAQKGFTKVLEFEENLFDISIFRWLVSACCQNIEW